MSVFVTLRMNVDPARLEEYAQVHVERVGRVADASRAAGAMRHAYAGGDNEVMIIDEWPDEAAFRRFFASQPEIAGIMSDLGVQGEPEVSVRRRLDTPDTF